MLRWLRGRVSNPNPFHTDSDPGFEIFTDPDLNPGLDFSQKLPVIFLTKIKNKKPMEADQNEDP